MTTNMINRQKYEALKSFCELNDLEITEKLIGNDKLTKKQIMELLDICKKNPVKVRQMGGCFSVHHRNTNTDYFLNLFRDMFVEEMMEFCPHHKDKVNWEWLSDEFTKSVRKFELDMGSFKKFIEAIINDEDLTEKGQINEIKKKIDEIETINEITDMFYFDSMKLFVLLNSQFEGCDFGDAPPKYTGIIAEYIYFRTKYGYIECSGTNNIIIGNTVSTTGC